MKTIHRIATIIFFLFIVALIAGCGKTEEKMVESEKIVGDSTIVRDKDISVASLDNNLDGYVYQCPMHYNVIADVSAQCSFCMMDLEKYSVTEAQKNLKENHSQMH